jgi:hypothetical protein
MGVGGGDGGCDAEEGDEEHEAAAVNGEEGRRKSDGPFPWSQAQTQQGPMGEPFNLKIRKIIFKCLIFLKKSSDVANGVSYKHAKF